MTSEPISLVPGDLLKIERRYMVDGVLTTVTDKGRFGGVQVVGSAEHIVLQDATSKEVRLFPLHAVSEITLVKANRRRAKARGEPAPVPAPEPSWDPGVA